MIPATEPTNENNCCRKTAQTSDAGFCGDCGKPILKCPAYSQCGGIVGRNDCCQSCFSIGLYTQRMTTAAELGGTIAISLRLQNRSATGRTLFLKGIWFRTGNGELVQLETAWDRVNAGQSNSFVISLDNLDRAGSHQVEVVMALGSRWEHREEVLMFTGGLQVTVEKEKEVNVQQNIHYAAETPQTGATIYAPVRVISEDQSALANVPSGDQEIELCRATTYERKLGFRGTANGLAVQRTAVVDWHEFLPGTIPPSGPIRDALVFGRSKTRARGGSNDVQLVVVRNDGTVDQDSSLLLSRNQFEIWIENDRLMVRVNSENGVRVNERVYSKNAIFDLQDGDQIFPIASEPSQLAIQAKFEVTHDEVIQIRFEKIG